MSPRGDSPDLKRVEQQVKELGDKVSKSLEALHDDSSDLKRQVASIAQELKNINQSHGEKIKELADLVKGGQPSMVTRLALAEAQIVTQASKIRWLYTVFWAVAGFCLINLISLVGFLLKMLLGWKG